MEHNHKQDQHDRIMINRIKDDLEDWLTTHGEVTMGSEMVEDVHRRYLGYLESAKGWSSLSKFARNINNFFYFSVYWNPINVNIKNI